MKKLPKIKTHFTATPTTVPKNISLIKNLPGEIWLQWDLPIDNGGANIISYTVAVYKKVGNSNYVLDSEVRAVGDIEPRNPLDSNGMQQIAVYSLRGNTDYRFDVNSVTKNLNNVFLNGEIGSIFFTTVAGSAPIINPTPTFKAKPFCDNNGILLESCLPSGGMSQYKWEIPHNNGGLPVESFYIEYKKSIFPNRFSFSAVDINSSKTIFMEATMSDDAIAADLYGHFDAQLLENEIESKINDVTDGQIIMDASIRDLDTNLVIDEEPRQIVTMDLSVRFAEKNAKQITNISIANPAIFESINHNLNSGMTVKIIEIVAPVTYACLSGLGVKIKSANKFDCEVVSGGIWAPTPALDTYVNGITGVVDVVDANHFSLQQAIINISSGNTNGYTPFSTIGYSKYVSNG